ncbi:hypothetical protein NIBR502772_22220 [Pseudarthrobacter sp. NIBRBAC000502772]|uniref:hypothetical protein n=1 Tax=Pseudarthrobacter sp. NIBRBAC000502772 TaxID=2590775 RepID=UPI00112FD463|nr:hypothetical protein [Pseudarthrobacter sp. NIBRBAC000502772]QDG68561.1 hypothetical protein NIBR502772_22220 [Pseudarthrobacter sp. NIBRBAC000502772]
MSSKVEKRIVVDVPVSTAYKTELSLTLEYQPEGMVGKVGDLLHVVARQAEHDLKKFKEGEIRSAAQRKVRKPNDDDGTLPPLGGTLGDR